MGFRLNIAKEPPTFDNQELYTFNNEYMISEGGAWEFDIYEIIKKDAETINITRQKCNTYPNCFMCDCSDDIWNKISLNDLKGKDKYLKNNSNIAMAFLLNINDCNDEEFESKSFCNYDYIIKKSHRDYIWINIS